MTFQEYLKSKKIDPDRYRRAEAAQYQAFDKIFLEVHPASFTAQKLFLLNGIRRRFPLKEDAISTEKKPQVRPKITPRIQKGPP